MILDSFVESSSDELVDVATRLASNYSTPVVSSPTLVRAWDLATSKRSLAGSVGAVIRFDYLARQAIASASAWAQEQGRSSYAGDVLLAVLIQASPSTAGVLAEFGWESTTITNDLRHRLAYTDESTLPLARVPGAEAVSSLSSDVQGSVQLKLSNVSKEAVAGEPWEAIWARCERWVDQIGDAHSLDSIALCSVKNHLRDESEKIFKEVNPGYVTSADLRDAGGRWIYVQR